MKHKEIILLVLIVIIASFFRLYGINETPPGFYPDEAIYANNGVEAWEIALSSAQFDENGLKIFYPENNGREGLWPNIIGFFVIKFGHEPWVSRSVAAVFGILTVLGVYFLAKELFSCETAKLYENTKHKIALLSSFLLATSFWHILFSRIGFRAIMAPFFLVWGVYFLLTSLRRVKEQKSPKFYVPNYILGGIFYGFGFHTYIAYRATPLLILIIVALYWLQNKNWQIRKKILLLASGYTLMAILIAAPLGIYFIENPQDFFGRTTQVSVFNSPTPIKDLTINILKTAGMFNFSGDYNWRHNIAGRPLLFWPIGILFIIGIIIGLLSFSKKENLFAANVVKEHFNIRKRVENLPGARDENKQDGKFSLEANFNFDDRKPASKKRFSFIILFAWLIISALPVVISNEGLPHALRAILMAPTIFILAGVGGIWLIQKLTHILQPATYDLKYKLLSGAGCLLLIIFIIEAYNSYFIKWGKSEHTAGAFNQNYVDIGRKLNALPKELPKYVIVEAGGVDVRGIPMPAQTVMFITDTFTKEKQKEKNIFYILPNQTEQITKNQYTAIIK